MQKTSSQTDHPNESSYVRVVLAHKDWLNENLSSGEFVEILQRERLDLKNERAGILESQRPKSKEMLEVVTDILTEALQGIEMMLMALKDDNEDKVLEGLTILARATSALGEVKKHL